MFHKMLYIFCVFTLFCRIMNDKKKVLTAAGLAIEIEDVAPFTCADVGLWNGDTVVLTAMISQVTVVYSWRG